MRTRASYAISAIALVVGLVAGVVADRSWPRGPWHAVMNTCAQGQHAVYIGAGEDGSLLFRGDDGCMELWRQ